MEQGRKRQVQLYSDELTGFCKDNKLYLDLLKDHVEELNKLKQHEIFLKQSKTENEIHRQSKAADPRNLAVMFTPVSHADRSFFKTPAKSGEYEDLLTSHQHSENPFCYLCTTLEQHREHIMKTKKRVHGKKRIPYEAPPPFVAPKPLPEKPEGKECLFKVTVKTGADIEAACSVPVYISLQGEEGKLRKARLAKKFGSLGFFFDSGSTEVFHLRGPRIGRLSRLTLTLGDEANAGAAAATPPAAAADSGAQQQRRRKWLVDSVTIKDYGLGLEYHFVIDKWLRRGVSKRSGIRRDQVRLAPTTTAKSAANSGRGVLVTTYTGRKATAGTDCRVYISMMGTNGAKGRHELRQPQDTDRVFQPGGKDVFELYVEDFGDLKGIRLELDTHNVRPPEGSGGKSKLDSRGGRAPEVSKTWFVDQVIVKDIKSGQKWLFTIADWLNEDNPVKEFWTVKDVDERLGVIYRQKTVYEIVTKTGNKNFAGTDSTISLSLFDKDNRRCDIELKDDDKSKFEKGKIDTIRENARVIDTPERLKVSISGTGVAPDWFMDGKITVTKYLVTEEILQHLQRLQCTNKMPEGLAQEKGKILFEALTQKRAKRHGSADSRDRKPGRKEDDDRGRKTKKTSDGGDSVDGDIFGRGRTGAGRGRPVTLPRRGGKGPDLDDTPDEDSDKTEDSDGDSSDADSVKSHDDYDPEHGTVRLPYAVQVSFAPRSKEEAWLKKDKPVELHASDAAKLLYRELRVRSDNENAERLRKELLEKERAKAEEIKLNQQKKQQEQKRSATAKKPGSRAASRSQSRGRTSSSSSEEPLDGRKSTTKKPTGRQAPIASGAKKPPPSASRRRQGSSSSDSDSSTNTFDRPTKKLPPSSAKLGGGGGGLKDQPPVAKPRTGAGDGKQPARAATGKDGALASSSPLRSAVRSPGSGLDRDPLASKRGLDHVDYAKERDKGTGQRTDLDKDRGRMDLAKGKDRSPLDLNRAQDRSPRDLDRGRDRLDFDRSKDKSPLDLDKGRGGQLAGDRTRDVGKDHGRLDFDKGLDRHSRDLDRGLNRSPRDLDKGHGRLDFDKALDRNPRDLDKGRGGRLDFDKDQDRGALDLDRGRGRVDFDKGLGRSPRDLDKGHGRLDFDKGLDRNTRDLDRGMDRNTRDLDKGRGRLDFDKGQDRGALDLDRGRGRVDLDKGLGRNPRDLDKGHGRLDFDRGLDRNTRNLDKGLGRSPGDLDKGLGRSPRDLDKGHGRLDFDRGLDRNTRDLDKGLGRSPGDLDKGQGRLDFDKGLGRSPRDLDKGRGRQDFDQGRNPRDPDGRARAGAPPVDNPHIRVTPPTDDRAANSGLAKPRQRSFNLDF